MGIHEEPQKPQHRSLPCAVLTYQEIHVSNRYVGVAESSEIVDEQMKLHFLSRFGGLALANSLWSPAKNLAAKLGRLLGSVSG